MVDLSGEPAADGAQERDGATFAASQLWFQLPDFRVAARAEQSLPDRKPRRPYQPGLLGVSLDVAAESSLLASSGGQVILVTLSRTKDNGRRENESISVERGGTFPTGTPSLVPSQELDSASRGDL